VYANGMHLDELDLSALHEWKAARVEESRTLDFKEDAYVLDTAREVPKRDFVSDVCGFGNAGGGIILLGVAEERDASGQHGSRFGEIVGVDLPRGLARYQQQADEMVRASIEPRGIAFRMREIATGDPSRSVVAIGVERSAFSPHRLCAYGSSDFFIRRMRSVDKMGIDEVREAIRQASTSIRTAELRLDESEARMDQIPSEPGPFLWIAISPATSTPFTYPTADRELFFGPMLGLGSLRPGRTGYSYGFDTLGAAFYGPASHGPEAGRSTPLLRVLRDGTVETVERLRVKTLERRVDLGPRLIVQRFVISGSELALAIDRAFREFMEVRRMLGISGPTVVSAGFRSTLPCELEDLSRFGESSPGPTMQATARLLLRPRLETSDETLGKTLKTVADFFWNSWGYIDCHGFDREGRPTPVLESWIARVL
jgi:hypothetical protein